MSDGPTSASEVLRLQFDDDGTWSALPSWGNFFVDIGFRLGLAVNAERRLVVATVVPTRAFGAAFVGLGVVLASMMEAAPQSRAEHFAAIAQLPLKTPVLYRLGSRILKAIIDGTVIREGRPYVRLRIGTRQSYLVPEQQAENVQAVEGKPWPLQEYQRGRQVTTGAQFAEILLGRIDAAVSSLESRLDVVFLGRRSALEHEIRRSSLAVTTGNGQYMHGTLQDALRVRRFAPGALYRSDVLSIESRRPPKPLPHEAPIAAIFDGARSFLRWRHLWVQTHQFVMLDRVDARFDEAVATINLDYVQRRAADGGLAVPSSLPPGTELLVYSRDAV